MPSSENFPPTVRAGRSVNDFDSEEELRKALSSVNLAAAADDEPTTTTTTTTTSDWMLAVPDADAEQQTVEEELQRLLTLKSYLILDAAKEEAFDRLTKEACRYFSVPTSLISLVDLGRQFLMSSSSGGSPDDNSVRETPRSVAFCAHTILSKSGICVVNDTKKDSRFRENKLVTGPPYLRFYAGAPLISPEGYRLGTLCVEGPSPREFTEAEKQKLQEFAAKAMELMVDRRRVLQQHHLKQQQHAAADNEELRRHAAVTTNLGGILYRHGECVAAMRLFQESVQTLMYVEEEANSGLASKERRDEMAQLLNLLSADILTEESRLALIKKLMLLVRRDGSEKGSGAASGGDDATRVCRSCVVDGIPGLFSASSRLKGFAISPHLAGLVFAEPFQVSMEVDGHKKTAVDERVFIIPLKHCSKAALFNMGLIHYHWGSPDTAMQFFDLAASLSKQHTPLDFDPVALGCLNNMAQIHLQFGRPNDAMELLSDALARGNAALVALYGDDRSEDRLRQEQDSQYSRRLRRKLARTVLNLGHVHFSNCNYDASMATCKDALRLLYTNMEEMEVAAVWYNTALLLHHQGNRQEALHYIDRFLELAEKMHRPTQLQIAEGLYRRGIILFEMGNLYECMKPLNEVLRIRRMHLGERHSAVAECLLLIGKVLQQREEYDFALNALKEGLSIQESLASDDNEVSFETAQALLEVGRAYHAQGNLKESLDVYLQAASLMKNFFGERHSFVARIDNIVGNLYLESGKIDESLRLFEEAMKIHLEQGDPVDMSVVRDPLLGVELDHSPVAAAA